MQSNSDFSLPSGKKSRIYKGEDFDDAIINAMDASSERASSDYGAAADMHRNEDYNDYDDDDDVERGSLNTDSSGGSEADGMSLQSDDISIDSDSDCSGEDENKDEDDHVSVISNVPLVNDDESVMEMKNPAPVSQSVSSYVNQLNRKERGKTWLITAGVLIFIAITVGVPLAVTSLSGNKSKGVSDGNTVEQSSDSQTDQNIPSVFANDENALDKLFRSVEVTMNGAISLSGLVIPTGESEVAKDVLEKAITETVSKSLTRDQTLMNLSVTSIGESKGRILYRVLEEGIFVVKYEMIVKERCRDCNDNVFESIRKALYIQVASDVIKAIATGDFNDDLHNQAKIAGNNALLSAIAFDGFFERQASLSTQPTAPPTRLPTPQLQPIPAFNIPQRPLPPSKQPSSPITAFLPQLPPPPTLRPSPISPVAQATYFDTPSPTTMAPVTSSPSLSPVTEAPVTQAPFTLPPVEFAPTDPPVIVTPKPTRRPTKRPTPRPTIWPTPR